MLLYRAGNKLGGGKPITLKRAYSSESVINSDAVITKLYTQPFDVHVMKDIQQAPFHAVLCRPPKRGHARQN